jgi:hypothetical protein
MSQGKMSFAELVKDWILAMPRIRRIMIERGRAVAETDAEREIMKRIWSAYQEDMQKAKGELEMEGRSTEHQDFVVQSNLDDLYTGPIIHGRFQVMGSVVPKDTFYLADLSAPDAVLREKGHGEIRRFATKEEAEAFAAMVAGGSPASQQDSRVERVFGKKRSSPMAKKTSDAQTKEAKTKAPRGPSASSRFKELIMANGSAKKPLTDEEIFAKVAAEFNLDDSKKGYVAWYRNDLKKKGENPPDPVGGAPEKLSKEERVARMQAGKAAKSGKAPPAPPAKMTPAQKAATKKTTAAVEAARETVRGRKPGRAAAA